MSKWIRGRLRRPIAGMISVLMLVSLLLPLAPPPALAQTKDLLNLLGEDITEPTHVVVLDFYNKSGHATGALGRTFADALTVELLNTRNFEVVRRDELDAKLAEMNLNVPLSYQAQAMVADRLKCPFTVSGEVEGVKVQRSKDGTFAEVTVKTVVISKVTRLPINGAEVTQKSSPKIGYSGNPDVLINEALATAAYQTAQQLLNNRLPITTVLTSSTASEIHLRGGATIGIRKGMEMVSVRRSTVTGRLLVKEVNPTDSLAEVVDNGSIAPGDKAVPIFEFPSSSGRLMAEAREKSGMQLLGLAALGVLAGLVGTNGGNSKYDHPNSAVVAAPMADSWDVLQNTRGANIVKWDSVGSRAIAYAIYRNDILIDVVEAGRNIYKDTGYTESGGPADAITVDIALDQETGVINYARTVAAGDPTAIVNTITADPENVTAECYRQPLVEGERASYQIRAIYKTYDPAQGQTDLQWILMLGAYSSPSAQVAFTVPPRLTGPADDSYDGQFSTAGFPQAMRFRLELSTDPSFPRDVRYTLSKDMMLSGGGNASAFVDSQELYSQFASATGDRMVYWRVGTRISDQPEPASWLKLSGDPSYNALYDPTGYVFSERRQFLLSQVPVPPALSARRRSTVEQGEVLPGKVGIGRRNSMRR